MVELFEETVYTYVQRRITWEVVIIIKWMYQKTVRQFQAPRIINPVDGNNNIPLA